MKTRIFFDMDGTLMQWKSASVEELCEPGYFSSLTPNVNVINIARHFALNEPDYEAFTLSAVLPDSQYIIPDKHFSLDTNLPEIDQAHRLFVHTGVPKYTVVPGGIRPTDVIVDDYTVNLLAWNQYAIGIKLLNGINHTRHTWKGPCIDMNDDAMLSVIRIKNVVKAKLASLNMTRPGKIVVMMDNNDKNIDAVAMVKNWDDSFDACFGRAVEKWNASEDEFFDTIIPFLNMNGYHVELLDYSVVLG